MVSWVTALIFVGGAIAAVFFAPWIAWRKRRSRTAADVRVDSAGGRDDRQHMQVSYRQAVDAAVGGMKATGSARYPAVADAARRPRGASTSADRKGRRPGGHRGTARRAGLVITSPPGSTSASTVLRWTYQRTGSGEIAGTRNATAAGSLGPIVAGVGAPPPEVAATLRTVVSELRLAVAALPGDFAQLPGEAQIRCMAGVAKHVPGQWLPTGAVTGDLDLPAERTNWTWTVFFEPGSTPGAQSWPTRPARSTSQALAGLDRPDPAHQAGDARTDDAADPGRSQTVILLDAAILDTLIAALLPGSHGVNYSYAISAIKISIRPRMLVIKSVNLTVGAILNAHGLGILAPAIARITTKILVPTLNLLLGPDCRHDKLMKRLDLLDVGLYTANGWPTDSPTFRSNLSDWVAGPRGAASRPDAHASGRQRPRPHPGQRASSHPERAESEPGGQERRSAPWSDTSSQGRHKYPPRTSPSSADSRAGAPQGPDPATPTGAAPPVSTSPGHPDPAWHPDRTSGTDGIRPGAAPVGRPRAAGAETPGVGAPPRRDLLPSSRPHRQGPPSPMR